MARRGNEKLAIGAREVLAAGGVEVRTDILLAGTAPFAMTTAEHRLYDDAVYGGNVGNFPADLDHVARKLMAHYVAGQIMLVLLPMAPVRAADPGHADANQDPVRSRQRGKLRLL